MSNVLNKFEGHEIQAGFRELITEFVPLVELSRDVACEHAESHRDFEVGNVGVAIKAGNTGLITVTAANFKIKHPVDDGFEREPEDSELENERDDEVETVHDTYDIPRDLPKVCAEMATIAQSEDEDLYFLAQIITGTTDKQEIKLVTNGISTRTLPSCEQCVDVQDGSPTTSKATLYVSAGLDEDIFQVRNMRMLKRLYRKRTETGVPIGRLSVENTALALDYFDQKIASHDFNKGLPSRVVSSFARLALTYPSTPLR